jgi:hypothetical protein
MIAELSAQIAVSIRLVTVDEIIADPHSADLFKAYAAACIVPDAEPQWPLYVAMERAGILRCFAAYVGSPAEPVLIGFASVICSTMPHDGHLVATLGELFVDLPYRRTEAEDLLLAAVEQSAADSGARCFICQARIGSKYDSRLARRVGFVPTQTQYTKWLNGYAARGEGRQT